MISPSNPYDELPYRCLPIEWTAPERLALASLLHGGPREPLRSYRVLELGCGDAANLLPLAYYRRHAGFVGLDGARSQIEVAAARKSELGLSNIDFIHTDVRAADERLSGQFDYIIAHGLFSWVPREVRDALLELCSQRLSHGGLVYLNYNTKPGWNVRGMVRDFLLAQTEGITDLRTRAEQAQHTSAKIIAALTLDEHPYSRLIANELQFVCENHISYVAHEYLAPDNHAYWRSEFLHLVHRYGLEYVADADFNYPSRQIPEDLAGRLRREGISGRSPDDAVDLLCYRQLHCPILTLGPLTRQLPSLEEFGSLVVASCLVPCPSGSGKNPMFEHPSGYQVEAKEEPIRAALTKLQLLWPRGLRVGAVFQDVSHVMDDLKLLQRSGLIELRCVEPDDVGTGGKPPYRLEVDGSCFITTPYHTVEAVGG